MMRRFSLVVVAICLAGSASAATVRLFDSYGSIGGGEFGVKFWNSTTLPSSSLVTDGQNKPVNTYRFATFCLEKDEFIGFNKSYDASISTQALGGGNNTDTGDTIDPRTAFLFTRFSTKNWSGFALPYDYAAGNSRTDSANGLQKAFWFLENELLYKSGFSYDSTDDATAQAVLGVNSLAYKLWKFADTAVRSGNWTGLGNVRVMNLREWINDGGNGYWRGDQSQLILVTPSPDAGLLGLLGLVAIGSRRRRIA